MNNKKKSKNQNEFIEEIKRIEQSGGGEALLDQEIMEMLLSSVHDRDQAQAITKKLMDNCPGIGGILGREIDDLKLIEGMTEPAAAAIICIKEASKMALREGLKKGAVMDDQSKLIEYIRVSIGLSEQEAVQVIYLDTQRRLIGDYVYSGTINEVHLYERKVVARKAASIILAHNHPGGSLEPSEEDKDMTMELASACQAVNIELLDHILVIDKGHFSFKKNDLL
ncbi:DNA repair protein RadC [Wolbachia endosymbiont of Pentalonia nigronervosa]|uniref:JAB domain-containing protein n=1 Tax=Wolbachia endosymbiont of Pentalonia nigronervosa TaxID=1301914 RepID=UPI00165FBC3F|nr:JAB domain-containing protein [Wolbachia endosymbiont of Pentalonia nigronervosa]MBD0392229.1 DNA repair protein RadC [Wolbachia endosymbiont of Pentalonia nigronervosa]